LALRQRRIGWLLAVFALLLAVAAARTLELTTIKAGSLASDASAEQNATVTIPAPRGAIVDQNGVVLATTEAAYDVTATPKLVKNPVGFSLELAPILHLPATTIENAILHPTSSDYYTVLAPQVSPATAQEITALKIPGLALTSDPRRVYPEDNGYLAAQVLGGVGLNGNGLGGIELEYNRALRGTAGVQPVVYDGAGQPIHVAGTTPVPGKTVQLTLDAPLQQYTDTVVSQTGEHFHAQSATAIVLNPQTGAVLAMSTWPRVNANIPSNGDAANDALSLYEPGSTFKVVAIGGALSDGLITPNTIFTVHDCIQVANYCIADSEYHPTEALTTTNILAQSSNVGAIEIAEKLGGPRLYYWMRRYGFGTPTGIGLPGDEQGLVPPIAQWSGSSIGNLPIGQGVDVTPLQVAAAYAAIADGGLLRSPHIVESVGGAQVKLPTATRILSPTVAAELRRMLVQVTQAGGTAAEIQIPHYLLAGKTGTANKVVDVNGTSVYSKTDYYASFVGFAPAQDPRVEAIVMVDSPQTGEIYGTEVAAPAWQRIMNFALPYLKISPY
jgi:cell division protein FtsI (penicillin-binding protein 3)/stage V sporulation protein D (sporulation-specific penicillin-binding protein)